MDEKTYDLFRRNGYRYCMIDVQKILLELKTEDNAELLIKIDEMMRQTLNVRQLAGFNLTFEELQK